MQFTAACCSGVGELLHRHTASSSATIIVPSPYVTSLTVEKARNPILNPRQSSVQSQMTLPLKKKSDDPRRRGRQSSSKIWILAPTLGIFSWVYSRRNDLQKWSSDLHAAAFLWTLYHLALSYMTWLAWRADMAAIVSAKAHNDQV